MSIETIVINIAFFSVATALAMSKSIRKVARSILSSYVDRVKSKINSLLETKAEYDQLLRKMLRRNDELDREVDNIINRARVTALQMEENAQKNIDELVQKKLEYTKKRIEEENQLLMQSIRRNCVIIATDTIKKIAETNYSNDEDQKKIIRHSYMQEM